MNEPLRSVSDAEVRAVPDAGARARLGSQDLAVEVEHLSASYRVHLDRSWRAGILDLFSRSKASDRLIPALRDVNFTVPKGEVLCVIGRNGAGKSTLLRAIAGVLQPEEGRVTVRGRVSTLSMGIGMSENQSGRDNIRLMGLAIGLEEERLRGLTPEIGEFAQLGEYLDFPVRTYSAGMKMRLAFAVSAYLDPEILLIDEALGGGDAKFREQTAWKMTELCGGGRTIVLVTHGLSSVRTMGTEALWLHEGKVVEHGDPDDVVAKYMRYCRLEDTALDDWGED
jgi:ABC-type polysaccharide/polyol phosphate transport system ATPase subunit